MKLKLFLPIVLCVLLVQLTHAHDDDQAVTHDQEVESDIVPIEKVQTDDDDEFKDNDDYSEEESEVVENVTDEVDKIHTDDEEKVPEQIEQVDTTPKKQMKSVKSGNYYQYDDYVGRQIGHDMGDVNYDYGEFFFNVLMQIMR